MQAIVFDGQAVRLDSDYTDPKPEPHEALIRLLLAGVCATDLEIIRGYAGGFTGIIGHEFVGQVVSCSTRPELVGRRVVGEINIGCGSCQWCQSGRQAHCQRRHALGIRGKDGVFAELLTLPAENLHAVPPHMPDEVAVFTEPLAAALRIGQQIALRAADHIIVLGEGRLGQLVARSLALQGYQVVVASRRQDSRAGQLLQRVGITRKLSTDVATDSADVVVDCTGQAAAIQEALRLVRPEGTVVVKSTFHGMAEIDLSHVVVDEVRIVGSRCGPFAPALALLASGALDPQPMIDAVYPLSQGPAALEHASRAGVLKVLLRPSRD